MARRGVVVAAVLSVALAACGAGAAPALPGRAGPTAADEAPPSAAMTPAATPAPSVAVATATPMATPPASPPDQEPTPTPRPAPPKPTGVDYARCCGEGNAEPESSVWWTKPRAQGVEIRVYGLTACIPLEDGSDDQCLRKGTKVPPSIRVLLARAPASRGTVSWYQEEDSDGGDVCAGTMLDRHGTRYYSVVLAAYGASGHSIFAIADSGWYDAEACAAYVVRKGDTLARIAGEHGLTVDDLIAANLSTLPDPDRLLVGSIILIPSAFLVEE